MKRQDNAPRLPSASMRSHPTAMQIPGGQSGPPSEIPQQLEDLSYLSSSACSEMTMAGSFPGSAYDEQYTSDPREAQFKDERRKRKHSIQNLCPNGNPPLRGPGKHQHQLDHVDKVLGSTAPATTSSYGNAGSLITNTYGFSGYTGGASPTFSSGPAGAALKWSPDANHTGDEPQLVVEDEIKEWDGQGKPANRGRSGGKSNRRRQ